MQTFIHCIIQVLDIKLWNYSMPVALGQSIQGSGWCWSCHPMISHMSIGERYDDLAGQNNILTLCRASSVTTAIWEQALNTPLNEDHEWQHNRLTHQTDWQNCSPGAWDNLNSALVVIGNYSPDHNCRCRSSKSRP